MGKLNLSDNEKTINAAFTSSFISRSIQMQIEQCENTEFSTLFLKYLPNNQPILEAGCGSGKWVGWFENKGWKATGLDWSEELIKRASEELKGSTFVCGDLREMPFPEHSFKAVVSLGSVEHSIEGPQRSISEIERVLNYSGIAIISVPYGSRLRKVLYPFEIFYSRIAKLTFIRKLFHKQPILGNSYKKVLMRTNKDWFPYIKLTKSGWLFYEYRFNQKQMEHFFQSISLEIVEKLFLFKEQGILHTFGKIVGHFDYSVAQVKLNILGKILSLILPKSLISHHICYILKKKEEET